MTIYTRPDLFIDPTPTPEENIGAALGALSNLGIRAYQQQRQQNVLRDRLRQLGVEEPLIDLYLSGSTGGQTDIIKLINRAVERGNLGGRSILPSVDEEIQDPNQLIQSYETANFGGLNPTAVDRTRSDLRKSNDSFFKDELKNVSTLQEQNRNIRILTQLNDRGNLPSGLGRLNVNQKTGTLKLPFLANKDAQQYVKTLQSFLNGLKNTFGARITNLDVSLYVQGLPTLANSMDGRRVVLNQMRIANEINQTYYNNLNNLIRRYGDRLTNSQLEYLAQLQSKDQIQALEQEYQQLDREKEQILSGNASANPPSQSQTTFDQLPSAAQNPNVYVEDDQTGDLYYSDGKTWKRVRRGLSNR